MRQVRFATVEEFDAWVKEAAIKLHAPASTIELWENIKKAVECLYNAAQWGLDAHPSHCQHDMLVAREALRPYEEEDQQKEGCTMLQEQQQQQKTYKWAVVYVIHARTPHEHIPQLFITDVPQGVGAYKIMDLLEAAGYRFGEFGIPWANHYIARHDRWNSQVVGMYNKSRRNPDCGVPIISWDKLVNMAKIDD